MTRYWYLLRVLTNMTLPLTDTVDLSGEVASVKTDTQSDFLEAASFTSSGILTMLALVVKTFEICVITRLLQEKRAVYKKCKIELLLISISFNEYFI